MTARILHPAKSSKDAKRVDPLGTNESQNEATRGKREGEAFVLDTSALLLGFSAPGAKLYTTSSAISEVRYGELQVTRLEALVSAGTLTVATPSQASLEKARSESKSLAVPLSPTDQEIVALALDLAQSYKRVTIVTDDHALQNIAAHLGISYKGLKHPEIREPKKRRRPRRKE